MQEMMYFHSMPLVKKKSPEFSICCWTAFGCSNRFLVNFDHPSDNTTYQINLDNNGVGLEPGNMLLMCDVRTIRLICAVLVIVQCQLCYHN